MNLGSEGLVPLIPGEGESFPVPPLQGMPAPLALACMTYPGGTDPTVLIAQHGVHTRPRTPSAAKFQGWK